LCGGSGGWTPAGALCLQLFVRKHQKSGRCLVKVEVKPLEKCGGVTARPWIPIEALVQVPPKGESATARKRKSAAARKK
jgi:hypothetical protein